MTPTAVRPAIPEDADELLRLRVAVLDGGPLTDEWRITFRDDMRERLGTDRNLLAYVVPTDGGLAACAIGIVYRGYLGPAFPTGLWGRIHTVVTDPAHQRRGHGRAVTTALCFRRPVSVPSPPPKASAALVSRPPLAAGAFSRAAHTG